MTTTETIVMVNVHRNHKVTLSFTAGDPYVQITSCKNTKSTTFLMAHRYISILKGLGYTKK